MKVFGKMLVIFGVASLMGALAFGDGGTGQQANTQCSAANTEVQQNSADVPSTQSVAPGAPAAGGASVGQQGGVPPVAGPQQHQRRNP